MIDVFYMFWGQRIQLPELLPQNGDGERERERETISRKSSTQKHSDSVMLQDFLGQIFFSFLSLFRMVIPQFADIIFGWAGSTNPHVVYQWLTKDSDISRDCSWLAQLAHEQIQRSQWWGMWGISHLLWTIGRLHTLRLALQFVHLQGLGEFQWASPLRRVLGRWAPSIGWLPKFRLGFDGWTADRVETRATGVAPNDEMNVSVATMHSRFHPFHTSTVQGKKHVMQSLQKLSRVASAVGAETISMFSFVPSFRTRGSLLKRVTWVTVTQ